MTKKNNDLHELLDVIARLPWWLGLLLATASGYVLHILASGPTPAVDLPGGLSGPILQDLASVGRFLIPGLLLLGSLISAGRRLYRRRLLGKARQTASAADLLDLSWQDFERLTGEAFRAEGFRVREAEAGPDGGVDLTLYRNGELYLVQCKRWRAHKVGVEIVRELYGVMAARGAAGGYVISSGTFTLEARRFVQGRNIILWDGQELKARIRGEALQSALEGKQTASDASLPPCPECGSAMVRRKARQGPRAGQDFLGCSRFPACRGTREITQN